MNPASDGSRPRPSRCPVRRGESDQGRSHRRSARRSRVSCLLLEITTVESGVALGSAVVVKLRIESAFHLPSLVELGHRPALGSTAAGSWCRRRAGSGTGPRVGARAPGPGDQTRGLPEAFAKRTAVGGYLSNHHDGHQRHSHDGFRRRTEGGTGLAVGRLSNEFADRKGVTPSPGIITVPTNADRDGRCG